jgi:hypothetical protein
MGAVEEHRVNPWPPAVRRAFWSLLAGVGVALGIGFGPAIGVRFGLHYPPDAVQAWLAVWVPLAVAILGGAFGVMAWGILSVNRDRNDRGGLYLLPARAGVIETRHRVLCVIYVATSVALAVALGGMGAALVARALGIF